MGLLNDVKIKLGSMQKEERQLTICELKEFIIDATIQEFNAKRFLVRHWLIDNTDWYIIWRNGQCELRNIKTKDVKVFSDTVSKYKDIQEERMSLSIIYHLGIHKEYEEWVVQMRQIDSMLNNNADDKLLSDVGEILKTIFNSSIDKVVSSIEEEEVEEKETVQHIKKTRRRLTKKNRLAKRMILDIDLEALELSRNVYEKNKMIIGKERANEKSKQAYKKHIQENWSRILALSKK